MRANHFCGPPRNLALGMDVWEAVSSFNSSKAIPRQTVHIAGTFAVDLLAPPIQAIANVGARSCRLLPLYKTNIVNELTSATQMASVR